MTEYFNRLSPGELERLALLSEEMGEVQHIIGKILRHGYESTHPDGGPTNKELLIKELGDVLFAIDLMTENNDLDNIRLMIWTAEKRRKVRKYLHHNYLLDEC